MIEITPAQIENTQQLIAEVALLHAGVKAQAEKKRQSDAASEVTP